MTDEEYRQKMLDLIRQQLDLQRQSLELQIANQQLIVDAIAGRTPHIEHPKRIPKSQGLEV